MASIDPKTELQAIIDADIARDGTFNHRGTDFTIELTYQGLITDMEDLWYKTGAPTQADSSLFQVYREAFEIIIIKAKHKLYDIAVQRAKAKYDRFIEMHLEMAMLDPRSFDEVEIKLNEKSFNKKLAIGYVPDPYMPLPLSGLAYGGEEQYAQTTNAQRDARTNRKGITKHRFEIAGRFVYVIPPDTEALVMQLMSLDLARDYITHETIDKFDTHITDDIVAEIVHTINEAMINEALLMIEAREKEGARQQSLEDNP